MSGRWSNKINLLPQLKLLHQTVKYKKKLKMQHKNLSEASRISEEAVKINLVKIKYIRFCYVYPIVMSEKLPDLSEEIHGFATSVTISQNTIRFGVNSCPKKEIRRDDHQADG